MATNCVSAREPVIFAAGDTLVFTRNLPMYPASAGWSIQGELTDPDTGLPVANFASAPASTQPDVHSVNVANFAKALAPKDYILSEEIINAGTGERHQVYYDTLTITPDLADGAGAAAAPLTTHAERQIKNIEAQLEYMASHVLQLTEEQRTRFEMVTRPDLMKQLREYKEIRAWELNQQRVRNGQSSANDVFPVFSMP